VALEALAASPAAAAAPLGESLVRALVTRVAQRWGVPDRLAHALVQTESNYDPRAVSPKGAMGLMQLMPATAQYYALDDPFNAEANLDAGMRHLRGLLDRYPVTLALAAYNAGEGAVSRYNGVPPYRETVDYVRRIQSLMR
jgi:soluble lytic murein transglycosylase-like protein